MTGRPARCYISGTAKGWWSVRTLSLIVVVAAVLASCTPSQVDPDAEIAISGRFVDGDGAPLSEQPVGLHVDPGPSILLWIPAIVASLGAACATDVCGADHETTTDPAGRFRFDLEGSDVAGSLGEEVDLLAEVVGAGTVEDQTGPTGRVRFVVRSEMVELPEVALWEPEVGIAADGVSWTPVPSSQPDVTDYEVLFQGPSGVPLWQAEARPEGLRVDPRILEDTTGGVAGVALVEPPEIEGLRGVELRTGTRRYRSGAGGPVSRGARCRAIVEEGEPVPIDPCPFTDGDLVTAEGIVLPCPQDDAPCPTLAGVELDLGADRPVELVVVRGCEGCRVAAGDAATQLTTDAVAVPLEATTRTVRVTGPMLDLREVSVWDGPPAGGLEAVTIEAPPASDGSGGTEAAGPETRETAGGTGEPGEASDDGRPAWLLLLATLLLGIAGGAVGTVLIQRRDRS